MARIKIRNLPKGKKISREEMAKVTGGLDMDIMQKLQTHMNPEIPKLTGPHDIDTMMRLQVHLNRWSRATQMQSNTIKTISDALKATVSNIR